jgi:DNA-binding CsgD family transcriptional regulator
MAVGLARDGQVYGTIAFGRHRDAGPITEADRSLARLLIPHLQRAVAISRLLDIGSVKSAMFESVIGALSVGVIVTDTSLRVLHANPAAQKMLDEGMPVITRHGNFSVPAPGATAALSSAVARAATDEATLGPNGFGVPIRFNEGQTHVFHVLPLRSGQLRPTVQTAGDAAIFIAPSQKSPLWSDLQVASLFDLTPAEARVFEGIASGLSVTEIAEQAGTAVGTTKTHLLQVFAKTGCHRQAELVALAAALNVPVW